MGTRNLIAVYMDGEYKIAQYSQWDGYPEGQGSTCLYFLREEMIEHKFRERLRKLRMIQNEKQMAAIKSLYPKGTSFPEFDRDTGADILKIVQSGETTSGCVANNIGFAAGTSVFGCEWAWVIDLDRRTFEAYIGYNKKPLSEKDRFYFLEDQCDEGYHPAKLVHEWSLNDLPNREQFLRAFREEDE